MGSKSLTKSKGRSRLHRGVDDVGDGADEQRVAVPGGAGDAGRGRGRRRTRPVLDDEALAELFAHLVGDRAGRNVPRAPGREAEDDDDRRFRVVLCPGGAGGQRTGGCEQEGDDGTTQEGHDLSPRLLKELIAIFSLTSFAISGQPFRDAGSDAPDRDRGHRLREQDGKRGWPTAAGRVGLPLVGLPPWRALGVWPRLLKRRVGGAETDPPGLTRGKTSMRPIGLGYVGFRVGDLQEWRAYGTRHLGFQVVDRFGRQRRLPHGRSQAAGDGRGGRREGHQVSRLGGGGCRGARCHCGEDRGGGRSRAAGVAGAGAGTARCRPDRAERSAGAAAGDFPRAGGGGRSVQAGAQHLRVPYRAAGARPCGDDRRSESTRRWSSIAGCSASA